MQGWCTRSLGRITGEMERRYGARETEHQRDVRPLEEVKFTWVRTKDLVSAVHPAAVTDHVAGNNQTARE